jgi:hypothetical protein
MLRPLTTVALTQGFLAQAKAEGMTDAEQAAMIQLLAANSMAGDLIVGSGGCRKVRIAKTGKGKSGGYRVVTFYAHPELPVYVFTVLSKASRENFDATEVAAMAAVAKRIKSALRSKAVGD